MRRVPISAGFAFLCLFGGSRWLADTFFPSLLPLGVRATLHFALILLVLGIVMVVRRRQWPARAGTVAVLGAVVFAIPASQLAQTRADLSGVTVELAFLLLPVGVLAALVQGGRTEAAEQARGLLLPVLAGLGGAMLLLPWSSPASIQGWFWLAALCVAVLASGWAVVELHALLRGQPLLSSAVLIALGSAAFAAATPDWDWTGSLTIGEWQTEAAMALLFDLPLLLLGVWCLRQLAPVRFSTHPLLALVVAVVESFVAARPEIAGLQRWTMIVGALLMLASAAWLLREGATE